MITIGNYCQLGIALHANHPMAAWLITTYINQTLFQGDLKAIQRRKIKLP
jgi:hypothetical protein